MLTTQGQDHTCTPSELNEETSLQPSELIMDQRGGDKWGHVVSGDAEVAWGHRLGRTSRAAESVPRSWRSHGADSPLLSQEDQPPHRHPINHSLSQNTRVGAREALRCSEPARSRSHAAAAVAGVRQEHPELPAGFRLAG